MKTTPHLYPAYPARYRLRLQGRLSVDWTDWLSNPETSFESVGTTTLTTLTGQVTDQAALFGLLSFVRDLGLTLISVEYLPEGNQENEL